MWVRSLDLEDPLEEGMATQSSILAWIIPMDRGAWWAVVHGVTKSRTRLSDQAQHFICIQEEGVKPWFSDFSDHNHKSR